MSVSINEVIDYRARIIKNSIRKPHRSKESKRG